MYYVYTMEGCMYYLCVKIMILMTPRFDRLSLPSTCMIIIVPGPSLLMDLPQRKICSRSYFIVREADSPFIDPLPRDPCVEY